MRGASLGNGLLLTQGESLTGFSFRRATLCHRRIVQVSI
jgi:hypothetical protein